MSTNISLFGFSVRITASQTFPNGFTITEWADDQAPVDSANIETAGYGMGPNGDMVVWQKPAALVASYSVIPNSQSDKNLSILHEANRISKLKGISLMDVITAVAVYQDGRVVTLSQGMIHSGPAVPAGVQDGRLSTRAFGFVFEDRDTKYPT